jgi:hypothetical protein
MLTMFSISKCDAVIHMSLAEKTDTIIEWLSTLPAPTDEQNQGGSRFALRTP